MKLKKLHRKYSTKLLWYYLYKRRKFDERTLRKISRLSSLAPIVAMQKGKYITGNNKLHIEEELYCAMCIRCKNKHILMLYAKLVTFMLSQAFAECKPKNRVKISWLLCADESSPSWRWVTIKYKQHLAPTTAHWEIACPTPLSNARVISGVKSTRSYVYHDVRGFCKREESQLIHNSQFHKLWLTWQRQNKANDVLADFDVTLEVYLAQVPGLISRITLKCGDN